MLIEMICLLCPALISMHVLTGRLNRAYGRLVWLQVYAGMLVMVNMAALVFTSLFSSHRDDLVSPNLFTVSFAGRYLLVSALLAWLLPTAWDKLRQIVRVELQVQPAEETAPGNVEEDGAPQ